MNIKTVINESIKDLDENQTNLSIVLNRCLRIAYYFKNIDEIIWLEYNLKDVEELKDNLEFKKELFIKIIEKYGTKKANDHWDKFLKDYIRLRTVETIDPKKQKMEKGVIHFSVSSLENHINMLEDGLKSNTIPDGLHPLDLYFKHESKVEIDMFLRTQIKAHKDVLGRIKNRAYHYLIDCENTLNDKNERNSVSIENNKNIFIIHGQNEAKWRELKGIVENELKLNPIILKEQPDKGMTIIEKFELYAEKSCYAFAIFTPDDVVENNGVKYFQARPNVIFELGWFCSFLGRSRVCIIFQEGLNMDIFSDFQGVIQKRFYKNISEIYHEIKLELTDIGII